MVEHTDSADTEELMSSGCVDVVYLNNAGQAALTPEVQRVGVDALMCAPWEGHSDDQSRIRYLFSQLIDSEYSSIAIMPSTAFAITLAARNIQRTVMQSKKEGRILLLQDQFNSAVYPWQQICEESGGAVSLEIVQHPTQDRGWTEDILDRIDETLIAACLPPLHWSNGELLDLQEIGAACKKYHVSLVVDATQAVGIMPLSMKKIDPEFLACSVHKWLRSPAGTCLVHVSKRIQSQWIPLDLHGRSRLLPGGKDWDAARDVMGPRGYPETFFDDARKFDSGGKPNPVLLPMLRQALEEVNQLDLQQSQVFLKTIVDPLLAWASSQGYGIPRSPHAYHLVGIQPPQKTPEELLKMDKRLRDEGIIIAVRCGGFRISPYLDTSASDIQKLTEALERMSR